MKKLIFTLSFFCFVALALNAQEVEEVQRSVVFKRTASWCSICGNWGWSLFQGLLEEVNEGGIMIAAHHSGDLTSPAAKAITDHFGAFGQPRFYLNEVDQNVSSGNYIAKKDAIKAEIESTFANESPVANAGMIAFYNEDIGMLELSTKTKFFQDASGKFNIGLYLIENDIVNNQAGQGSNAIHKKVMRESLVGSEFGELVVEGSVAAGTEFDKLYSFPMADPNQGNFEIVAIIWNEDANGDYSVVNAVMINEFDQMISNVADVTSESADLKVMPTVAQNTTKIEVSLNQNFDRVDIEIFNLIGQTVAILSDDNLMEGDHHFEVTKNEVGGTGRYFVRMIIGNQIKTKSLIFK
jgi:hypothetical protein